MDDAALEKALLLAVSHGDVESDAFASANGADHKKVVGLIKSLESSELVASTAKDHSALKLSPEAEAYLTAGSPEAQAFAAVPSGAGIPLADFKKLDKTISDIGFKQAMQQKWLAMEKGETPMVVRKADSVEDIAKGFLAAVNAGDVASVPPKELDALVKKRKLVKQETWKTFTISKGASFALERKKAASDLTKEMLQDGSWRDAEFKSYNLVPGAGAPPNGGCVHPLLKVRQQFREIFLQMGFAEMPTNNFVESGFWNFDTLIQPQMHPARDAHDTFFMKTPAAANRAPEDYVKRVRAMHETGGGGSIGHQYSWKRSEADKNILRTHTTAVSARCLHKLAQDGFRPAKFFSIDRVFRNEAVDRTHLAEFHQVEGVICDVGLTLGDLIGVLYQFFARLGMTQLRFKPAFNPVFRNEAVDRTHLAEFHQVEGVICDVGLTLGDLIGVLYQFFARLGMTQLRFKPAFNPYTEPSMEIFAYHPMLKKWVEVGNSGMFRPEMLQPMGLPEDVNVIAWGLSLERPTMIMYGIDNIRDLFGSKMQMSSVKNNPICRLGMIEQRETVTMTE